MTALCGFCSNAFAAHWYVSPNGADQNPGTPLKPFATIQHAADATVPGDVVHIGRGHYHEEVRLTHGGTADRPITFLGVGNTLAILDGATPLDTQAWESCGRHVFRRALPANAAPDDILLWEDHDALTPTQTLPLAPGSFVMARTASDAARIDATLCPELFSHVTSATIFLRTLDQNPGTNHNRLQLATHSILWRRAETKPVDYIVMRQLGFAHAAHNTAYGVIELGNTTGWQLDALSFWDNGSMAITGDHVENFQLTNSEITHGHGAAGGGVQLANIRGARLQNNFIHDNEGPGISLAPQITAPSAMASDRMTVRDNILWANVSHNVRIANTDTPNDNCRNTALRGVVSGNVIVGAYTPAHTDATYAAGLRTIESQSLHVHDNLFVGNQHALLIEAHDNVCAPVLPPHITHNAMLYSYEAHVREPQTSTTSAQIDQNIYSLGTRYDFLDGLFFRSRAVLSDPRFVASDDAPIPGDHLYVVGAARHDAPIPHALDGHSRFQSTDAIVLNAQLPFVYVRPPQMRTTALAGALSLIRLAGSKNGAHLRITMTPHTTAAAALLVQVNGHRLRHSAHHDNIAEADLLLSPWQNWIAISAPAGSAVDQIEITATSGNIESLALHH